VPRTTYPRDRFDEVADADGRVGAHRAENPRMRGGVVFLWAAAATVVLVVAGIFGTLVVTERIPLFAEPAPSITLPPQVEPTLDPSYPVLVLNASGQAGAAASTRDAVLAAGWSDDDVSASDAQSTFDTTTVFYVDAEDEAAALGLADAVGGAEVAQSGQYAQFYPGDEGEAARVLTVVLGTDRAGGAAPAS
jgi:hypothetical protein